MKTKLLVISAGLAVILGLELSGIRASYVDEVQSYLRVVIATFLASSSSSDILSMIKGVIEAKNAARNK